MSAKGDEQSDLVVTGTVIEALPNTMFRVMVEGSDESDSQEILGHLSGKMRYHRIKVVVGDTVEILLDQYSEGKGRITRRL